MPFTPITVVNGSTPANATWGNLVQTQYTEATLSFNPDLFTPFVVSGLVASKDLSIANQLDVTSGNAYLVQADGTMRQRKPASSTQTTATPSATYYLYLQPDGTFYWNTANSPAANSLWICQVATDGSGNISTVTDKRTLNVTLLPGMTGVLTNTVTATSLGGGANLPGGKLGKASDGDIMDASGSGPIFKNGVTFQDGSGGSVVFTGTNGVGFSKWGGDIWGQTTWSGTGAGTYTHGLSTTPSFVGVTSNQLNSTQTVGIDSAGSTTVHLNMPNSWPFVAMATKS